MYSTYCTQPTPRHPSNLAFHQAAETNSLTLNIPGNWDGLTLDIGSLHVHASVAAFATLGPIAIQCALDVKRLAMMELRLRGYIGIWDIHSDMST
jgi:hypothetical protein